MIWYDDVEFGDVDVDDDVDDGDELDDNDDDGDGTMIRPPFSQFGPSQLLM